MGYIPYLRQALAKLQSDPEWNDDTIYKHDAGLDIRRDGKCILAIEPL
jgi:hypothetical protein